MAEHPHQFSGKRKQQYPDSPQQCIYVSQDMTQRILPGAVKALEKCNSKHVYLYLMNIIALQSFYCVCGILWIIDLNLQCKHTHQKLYAVAEQLKFAFRGYTWGLTDKLFTTKDVHALPGCAKLILPNVIMNAESSVYMEKIHGVNLNKVRQLIQVADQQWFMNQPWHDEKKVNVIINIKECNSAERRYHIRKEKFVEILCDAAAKPVNLIYILVVDSRSKCGYEINVLWKVQINNDLSIGISFRNVGKNITANAIYVCVGIMSVYSALSGKSCGKFFHGWKKSQFNNILVGDRENRENALKKDALKKAQDLTNTQADLNRADEEINTLRMERDILIKFRDDFKRLYPNEYQTLAQQTMSSGLQILQDSVEVSEDIIKKFIALDNSKPIVEKLIKDGVIDPQILRDIQDDEEKNNENENDNNGSLQSKTSRSVGSKFSGFIFPINYITVTEDDEKKNIEDENENENQVYNGSLQSKTNK